MRETLPVNTDDLLGRTGPELARLVPDDVQRVYDDLLTRIDVEYEEVTRAQFAAALRQRGYAVSTDRAGELLCALDHIVFDSP